MFRAHLLGELRLTWHNDPLPTIPSRTARSLLAYLLTYRGQPHTRDLLAGTFWPELPDATARRRLSQALWCIRSALDPHPVLLTESNTVQWNPDLPLWLDVEEFTRHNAHGTDSRQEAFLHYERCVELYQGEFLAGYYEDWAIPERERLWELFLGALEQLVENYKRRGEYRQALAWARRLAREDPWREEAHREAMRLYHLLGRDEDALKQFETCRQILAQELDAEPSPESVVLAREIGQHSDDHLVIDLPAMAPPALLALDSAEARELPLVGREAERNALLAHVEGLMRGRGGVVLVEGEAGVGKTRLLQTIAHDAEWRGAEVLWGAGREIGQATPYGPLVEALSQGLTPLRIGQLDQLVEGFWLQVLAPLLPSLAARFPDLSPAPALDLAQERDRLVAALARLLSGWTEVVPLLLILEDLHWASQDTLDLLGRLVSGTGGRKLLLVGSFRGEEIRTLPGIWKRLQVLDRAGVQRRLELEGLRAEATGELVRHCLGMNSTAPFFEARLYQETRGNPLFVLETLRTLHGEGLLIRDETGDWSTPWDETTTDYAELPLPPAVEQTIARRLDSLSPTLRQTLDLAAVLGERFGFDLLRAASGEESQALLASVRQLVQRRFLDETERDYCFSHDKIRLVAYDRIDEPARAALHCQAARALVGVAPDQLATLARHWMRARAWEQAADDYRQAGDRARAVYASAEAISHYSQALEALDQLPDALEQKYTVLLARAAVYDLLGERDAQAKDLRALEVVAEMLDDDARRGEVTLCQANYANAISDYPQAIASAKAAIVSAQQGVCLNRTSQVVHLEAEALRQWAHALQRQGEYKATCAQLEKALMLAREDQLHPLEAKILFDLATVFLYQGRTAQSRSCADQALQICRRIGDRRGEAQALIALGPVASAQGDNAEAMAFFEQALVINRDIGARRDEGVLLHSLGTLYNTTCDYATARRYHEQALDIFDKVGYREGEGVALVVLGIDAYCQGDGGWARRYAEQAQRVCHEIGTRRMEG
ncbi:MAG: AAA family ATPase, partial [Anaerolineae bacterium]|nr:AAA family ATPase [Anaerolineae bacterium]